MKLLKVEISAENDDQARTILNPLLEAKLVTGGQIINSPARMLWKNEIISMKEYVMIHSYTIEEHKTAIIDSVRKTTAEEVPMITFNEIEVNDELQKWIMETVS